MPVRPARSPAPARPSVPRRAALVLGLVAALGSGCTALPGEPSAAPPEGSALEVLASVDVRGRAPKTGYSREEFGSGWVDTDHNGCDTRNDVLARDLTDEVFEPGTRDCVVASGTLADPYSGRTIAFRRGEGTSEAVQIDHVVALSDAWQKGAQQWDAARRAEFANDPLNLLAVDGPLNQGKGDSDAATWLPPARSARCDYVARQVAVKATYGLWMTRAERDAVAAVLGTCPDQPVPPRETLPAQRVPDATPPAPAGSSAPVQPPAPGPAEPYPDCAAVRAAGAAPIREGQPGWNPALDRDGDGVGCEG